MNQRIQSLADEAEEWNADGDKCEVNLARFAQLIVLDTIKDCRDMFVVNSVSWNLLNDKLEHFGVES